VKALHDHSPYVIGGVDLSPRRDRPQYLHLVKYVAGRISINLPPNVEINDLINDGSWPHRRDREVRRPAAASSSRRTRSHRINGAILDALRALDWVPRAVRQRARELERVYQDLEVELGRAATEDEVAERMGVSLKRARRPAAKGARDRGALRSRSSCPKRTRLRDPAARHVARRRDTRSPARSRRREIKNALVRAVDELPRTKSAPLISLYYFEGLTLKEIKGALNVSESRGLADPRPSGDPPAREAARTARRPRLP